MIKLNKPYHDLVSQKDYIDYIETSKKDYIEALTKSYFGDDKKITKKMQKKIEECFNKLSTDYYKIIQTIQTIKENEKNSNILIIKL